MGLRSRIHSEVRADVALSQGGDGEAREPIGAGARQSERREELRDRRAGTVGWA
ncbi:hypothetical protein [Heyndrickxia acidicola]|uniref:hypothetical protein n=1 Tax=Heyndrickxia acidicola TaxID=209389 RepID=UPI000A8AFF6D|nr:hypothetical protein [Heyndrickxia acidicola]